MNFKFGFFLLGKVNCIFCEFKFLFRVSNFFFIFLNGLILSCFVFYKIYVFLLFKIVMCCNIILWINILLGFFDVIKILGIEK